MGDANSEILILSCSWTSSELAHLLASLTIPIEDSKQFVPCICLKSIDSNIKQVTYMLPTSKGVFHHEDFAGNKGTIAVRHDIGLLGLEIHLVCL